MSINGILKSIFGEDDRKPKFKTIQEIEEEALNSEQIARQKKERAIAFNKERLDVRYSKLCNEFIDTTMSKLISQDKIYIHFKAFYKYFYITPDLTQQSIDERKELKDYLSNAIKTKGLRIEYSYREYYVISKETGAKK